jgi:hypothetical protein
MSDERSFSSRNILVPTIVFSGSLQEIDCFSAAYITFGGPPKIAGDFRRAVRTNKNNRLFSAARKNR